jgi:transcriptional regulator with XRE-family HTH domain
MYPNLRAEMARKNFTAEEMAKKIGRTNGTFSLKFNGKAEFSLAEAFKIKSALETDLSIDELIATE